MLTPEERKSVYTELLEVLNNKGVACYSGICLMLQFIKTCKTSIHDLPELLNERPESNYQTTGWWWNPADTDVRINALKDALETLNRENEL